MTAAFRELLSLFKQESYPNQWANYDDKDVVPVASLDHPNEAYGKCGEVSAFFAAWLLERGIDSELVQTENVNEWGMAGVNRYGMPSDSADHCAVVVKDNGREYFIDWTAAQFGERAFPYVKLWKDVKP